MKTRITVTPLKHNGELDALSKLAAANNSGLFEITINDVVSYIKARSAIYLGLPMVCIATEDTLRIDADKTTFAILSWQTIYELTESEANLIVQESLS